MLLQINQNMYLLETNLINHQKKLKQYQQKINKRFDK